MDAHHRSSDTGKHFGPDVDHFHNIAVVKQSKGRAADLTCGNQDLPSLPF